MSLEALKTEEAEVRQRVDAAQAVMRDLWAELRQVKAKIRAIEHPPRRMNERGLKPDDDLSFVFHQGRTSWPRDKEERHAEKWRRERIADALHYAWWSAQRERCGATGREDDESWDDYYARQKEFFRTTPIAELMRLEQKERGRR